MAGSGVDDTCAADRLAFAARPPGPTLSVEARPHLHFKRLRLTPAADEAAGPGMAADFQAYPSHAAADTEVYPSHAADEKDTAAGRDALARRAKTLSAAMSVAAEQAIMDSKDPDDMTWEDRERVDKAMMDAMTEWERTNSSVEGQPEPTPASPSSSAVWIPSKGRAVHPSHQLHRDISGSYFCAVCGKMGKTKIKGLAEPCTGYPTRDGRKILTKLKKESAS